MLVAGAVAAGLHWRKFAANVVLPGTLVALYLVWRWGRDD